MLCPMGRERVQKREGHCRKLRVSYRKDRLWAYLQASAVIPPVRRRTDRANLSITQCEPPGHDMTSRAP